MALAPANPTDGQIFEGMVYSVADGGWLPLPSNPVANVLSQIVDDGQITGPYEIDTSKTFHRIEPTAASGQTLTFSGDEMICIENLSRRYQVQVIGGDTIKLRRAAWVKPISATEARVIPT